MHFRNTPLIGSLLIALCAHVPAAAKEPPPIRALMVVGGHAHDYEKLPKVLADRLEARGEVKVRVTANVAALNSAELAKTDVLIFNTCEAAIPAETRQAIMEFVRGGKGLIALHCSLWSFQDWPEWRAMLGGIVQTHGRYGTYSVTVLDPAHPLMRSLGSGFPITDEPYFVDERAADNNLLIRTTVPMSQPDGKLRPGPDPQVWTRSCGPGRVLAITFGHDEKSQGDEQFLTLLHNGIRWAAGRLPATTEHNMLTKAEREDGWQLLFNGRDLSGWTGDTAHWSVQNGDLVGRSADLPHNMFLVREGEFGDFVLRYSVRLRNHNSGVQFRSRTFPESVIKGYQADIASGWYGSLYEEGGTRGVLANGFVGKAEKVVVVDGWNDMVIRAEGPRITIALNGLTTVDYTEKDPTAQPARGIIALQLHQGEPMEVRFRDIRLKPLPAP